MFTRHLSHSNINLTGISISFPESGKKNLARYSTEQYNLPGHRGHWILFKCTPNKMVWVESKHFKRVAAWHSNTMGQWQPKTHSPVDGRRRYNNVAERCNIMQHLDFVATWHGRLLPALPPPTNTDKNDVLNCSKFKWRKQIQKCCRPWLNLISICARLCTRCWSEMWKDARCM